MAQDSQKNIIFWVRILIGQSVKISNNTRLSQFSYSYLSTTTNETFHIKDWIDNFFLEEENSNKTFRKDLFAVGITKLAISQKLLFFDANG